MFLFVVILGEVLPKSAYAPFGLPYVLETLCKYPFHIVLVRWITYSPYGEAVA